MKAISLTFALAVVCIFSGCRENTVSVGITAYNHMQHLHIVDFYVNGTMGPNASPGGGGAETCCVTIPREWREGLKVKVRWEYDALENSSTAIPPLQEREVELPPYRIADKLQVHFYDDHKVKIVVSSCGPRHPFYPMSSADLLPWTAQGTKDEVRAAAQRGGMTIDC